MSFKFYTVLERLDKIEAEREEELQFYVDVEASVKDMIEIKEKMEVDIIKLEPDIKDRMTKIESEISKIKKALGLS